MPEGSEPLRVWLEPGYDNGKVGLWMLDWPGLFDWAIEISDVMANAPRRAKRHVEWLRSHGETNVVEPGQLVTVVEAVRTGGIDGVTGNATFRDDLRPMSGDELESAVRQAQYAIDDLLLAVRSSAGISDSWQQPDGVARTFEQVVRHVALSEVWLATRLIDATLPPAERDDHLQFLEDAHDWAVTQLRSQRMAFAGPVAIWRNQEQWTIRKVARRFVYHAIDHSQELGRRANGRSEATAAGNTSN